MKRFLEFALLVILFVLSYQVRAGFLATKDFNEPSDASEYRGSTNNAVSAIRATHGFGDLSLTFPWLVKSLDGHSAPVTLIYFTLIDLFFPGSKDFITTILQSLFVVFIFWVTKRLCNFWVAILISAIAVVYTPLFSYLYSYMPESFGGFFVSTFAVLAVFFALKASRYHIFAILAGICLGLTALYRIELRWVGIPFVLVWFFIQQKKNIVRAVLMIVPYIFLVGGWFLLSHLSNQNPYYTSSNVYTILYNAYNWQYFGWQFDTASIAGWGLGRLFEFISSQGILPLVWLEFAQVIRLWTRPATVYIGEYLIPDPLLFLVHLLLIGFALFGLRRIFFDRRFLFLSVFLIWGSFLSYAPEELRRQIPLLGIMMIFAGAGVYEFSILFGKGKNNLLFVLLIFLFLLHFLDPQIIYRSILFLLPFLQNAFPIRIAVLLVESIVLIRIAKKLYSIDVKQKSIFSNKLLRRIPSLVPLLAGVVLMGYQLRSPSWHQFSVLLYPKGKIEQIIKVDARVHSFLADKKGYILIDIKDPNGDKNLKIMLNRKVLRERLPLNKSMSPIDLLVHRQFQRGMPRLGWGHIEDEVASMSAFPNMHQWLILPISGKQMLETNSIIVENMSVSKKNLPFIFGDYFSSFNKQLYDGPTGRIFQGVGAFYKFQVDGDRRLPEILSLESKSNRSLGMRIGRYRIFFLFPYRGGDPESLF